MFLYFSLKGSVFFTNNPKATNTTENMAEKSYHGRHHQTNTTSMIASQELDRYLINIKAEVPPTIYSEVDNHHYKLS